MPTPTPINEDAASIQTMRAPLDHLDRQAGLEHVAGPVARAMDQVALKVEATQGPGALAWMERQAALTEEVRAALVKTGRDATAAASVATIMVNFPNHWREYRDRDGSPHLLAYMAALDELADPKVWAPRLRSEATTLISHAGFKCGSAAESLDRLGWASAQPAQLMSSALACAKTAIDEIGQAQRLFAEADMREFQEIK